MNLNQTLLLLTFATLLAVLGGCGSSEPTSDQTISTVTQARPPQSPSEQVNNYKKMQEKSRNAAPVPVTPQ